VSLSHILAEFIIMVFCGGKSDLQIERNIRAHFSEIFSEKPDGHKSVVSVLPDPSAELPVLGRAQTMRGPIAL